MKIAISNLAWEKVDDNKIVILLNNYKINAIELAPTKIWSNPIQESDTKIKEYRKFWNNNGISIVAITSLLFGHPELTIFSDVKTRNSTLKYLKEMTRISFLLGAKAMVFGSPKNRNTNGLPKKEVIRIASDFFYEVGSVAKKFNIYFGIEANPPVYGTDFINSSQEAIDLVKKVNHPNFRVHLDLSTIVINKESYNKTLEDGVKWAKHLHISEPGLKAVPQKGGTDHKTVAKLLHNLNYNNYASIEMPLNSQVNNRLTLIEKSLKFVTNTYN